MTPAERQLVAELFDRLATLEDAPRDPEAERLIRDGTRQAPNAVYALVQTTLVQDEALKRASARIEELEAALGPGPEPQRRGGGFLDNMRDGFGFGRRDEPRGSVPSVRPGEGPTGGPPGMGPPPGYGSGAPMGAPPGYSGGPPPGYGGGPPPGYGGGPGGPAGYGMQAQPQPQQAGRGGSFLGTAAAAAAGAIGGSLLLNSIQGMMGHRPGGQGGGQAMADPLGGGQGGSPWGGGARGGNDDLARQAGLDDIGRSSGSGPFGQNQSQGLAGGNDDANENDDISDSDLEDDGSFDDDGFDGGGDDGGGGGGD